MTVDERLALAFIAAHPYDAARLLERGDPEGAAEMLGSVPPTVAASIYQLLAPAPAAASAAVMAEGAFARIVEVMPLDIASTVVRRLDADRRERVTALLSEVRRAELRVILAYPPDTAAAIADPLALALPDDITVRIAQRQLRGSEHHLFYHIFVVGRDRRLRGTLAIPDLMQARPRQMLSDVMQRDPVCLHADMDLATVAVHPAWRDADALPVVDAADRMIGAIRHRMIRQLAQEPTRPMVETIVGLSELYWAGLSGILTSLTPVEAARAEDAHGT
jgi:magnesium transporter